MRVPKTADGYDFDHIEVLNRNIPDRYEIRPIVESIRRAILGEN
jgi:hypothetical protein